MEEVAPLSVLVIDDDRDHAELLATIISDREHRAMIASTASDALAVVSAVHVDLIFVDIGLPDLDGYQLVEQLRAAGVTCRIVITTAYGDRRTRLHAIRPGIDGFLLKPFPVASVLAELGKARG